MVHLKKKSVPLNWALRDVSVNHLRDDPSEEAIDVAILYRFQGDSDASGPVIEKAKGVLVRTSETPHSLISHSHISHPSSEIVLAFLPFTPSPVLLFPPR